MRKILCIILTCLICSITPIVLAVDATQLQDKQKEVQEQINKTNDELSDLKMDITENLEQVQKLDEKIATAEAELAETTEKVEILQTTIKQLEEQQKTEQEKYDTQKEVFEQRVVALYEAGDTQYIDIILKAKSITDFISSYYVLSEIADYDSEMLQEIGERKHNIENTKEKLEKEKLEVATIIERQTRTSKVLQSTKALRESYISKLSDQEKETQEKLEEYNKVLEEVNKQLVELAKNEIDTAYIGGELAWPVPGYTKISSPYGMRTHPITKVYKLHTGVDISAPMGANFVAANDGIVIKAEYNIAYGKMVVIDHGGGISTLYAHGSEFLVKAGDTVKRNQAVLKVGSTGYSTGAHAHFEVRKNGKVTSPMPYITNGIVPNSEEDKAQSEQDSTINTTNTSNTVETTNTTAENKTENSETKQQTTTQ